MILSSLVVITRPGFPYDAFPASSLLKTDNIEIYLWQSVKNIWIFYHGVSHIIGMFDAAYIVIIEQCVVSCSAERSARP